MKNLKRVAKELGETMSEEELREMIERADATGDGTIGAGYDRKQKTKTTLYKIYSGIQFGMKIKRRHTSKKATSFFLTFSYIKW